MCRHHHNMETKINDVWVQGGAVRITAVINGHPANGTFALVGGGARDRLRDEAIILEGRANVLLARAQILREAANQPTIREINRENA